jgi:hypothetical protein
MQAVTHLQQPPRQSLAVELCKQVLVADVCQQLDNLLQSLLNRLVTQLLTATLPEQTKNKTESSTTEAQTGYR